MKTSHPIMYRCPHCKTRAHTRTSKEISPILRELYYQCPDPECGHSFVVHAEAVRTLSPSAKPDPLVYLPISENTRRAVSDQAAMTQPGGAPGVRLQPKVKEAGRAVPF